MVFSLDRPAALARLREAAAVLRQSHPEVEAVFLVGSLARGEAGPGSDADVLVLLRSSDQPFAERVRLLLADWPAIGLAVDLLPFSREEFDLRLRDGDPFVRRLAAEALPL